jgi:opine dehydrogenase
LEIAVIGGGNGAYAAAAELTEQGHRIRLWRRDREGLAALRDTGALTLRDAAGPRAIRLGLVSNDLGDVLAGAALVVVPLPAFAQESIAAALAPHLVDGQIVLLPPGSFGSLVMDRLRRRHGNSAAIAFAETGTLPYLARKHGPCEIIVSGRATRLPTGVYPAARSAEAFERLRLAYPAIEPLADALDGALMNAGPIIHPPLILMNAGPIEHFPHWDIHAEGTQPAIRRVTDALDAERIATRIALGYGAPHFPLADHYSASGEEWMYGRRAHDRLVKSSDWREHLDLLSHRYMREDVACGLAFLVSVAEWAGVPCPVARGLLALGSAVVGEDFRATGRTLENLALANRSPAALRELLRRGEAA